MQTCANDKQWQELQILNTSHTFRLFREMHYTLVLYFFTLVQVQEFLNPFEINGGLAYYYQHHQNAYDFDWNNLATRSQRWRNASKVGVVMGETLLPQVGLY